MAQVIESEVGSWTVADLFERFGSIPLSRIRFDPPPGQATERDVIEIHDRENRLYELVDGVLVEKAMGFYESYLAGRLVHVLWGFVIEHDLGVVMPSDDMMRIAPDLVRIPDVSFISWSRLPGRRIPEDPIPALVPDLAVEVLSKGNTRQEMERKLDDYFRAGVRLVWYVSRRPRREVRVYTSPSNFSVLGDNQTLDGGEVLPGFKLELNQLFAAAGGPGSGTEE